MITRNISLDFNSASAAIDDDAVTWSQVVRPGIGKSAWIYDIEQFSGKEGTSPGPDRPDTDMRVKQSDPSLNEVQRFRAPARINIIGEHTDYNDGLVFPTTTALFTSIAARPRPDRIVRIESREMRNVQSFDLDDIEPA